MTQPKGGIVRELTTFSYGLALVSVHFYFVAYFMSLVEVPSALVSQPDWVVGLVVGSLGVAGVVTRPLVGVLVDAGNRQFWMRLGAIGTTVAFIGYASSSDPWTMLLFRLLHGAATGLFTTALLAMVTSLIPQRGLGLGMGIYQSSNAGAQFYAAALAVWLTSTTSVAFVFMVGAVVSGLALLFGMFVSDVTHGVPVPWRPWRERQWISRTGLVPSLVFTTMTTTAGALAAFLPLFVIERQLGNVGLFYSMFALSLLPTRLLAGAISDRVGRGGVLMAGLALGSLTFALLSVTQSQTMLLLVALLYGLSFGAVQITCVALVADNTPIELLGAGMATYTMAWDVGAVVGGVLLAPLVEMTSYAVGFGLIAALPLLGLWMYMTRMNGGGYSSLHCADAENRSSG